MTTLNQGDMIEYRGVVIEIGENQTMRPLRNEKPIAGKETFQPIPESARVALEQAKGIQEMEKQLKKDTAIRLSMGVKL